MSEHVITGSTQASRNRVKTITQLGVICAVAYLVMVVGRIPMVLFLKYDPKDVVIVIGGFIFGPLAALAVSCVVSLVEMVTVSSEGVIGLIMNILSTCAFVCTASFIYKKKRSVKGAVTGLIIGGLLMTAVMLLWNYLITPWYMGYPREAVVSMLVPFFLPFNLVKAALNIAITLLLYKPVVTALRKARLLPESAGGSTGQSKKSGVGVTIVSAIVLITAILIVLVMQGVL